MKDILILTFNYKGNATIKKKKKKRSEVDYRRLINNYTKSYHLTVAEV